jgi:hypothetical protein
MPKDFIVIRADHKEDWSGQYGPMKTYSLTLEETPQGSGISHEVEMNQKPTTAPPQPGETLTGDITPNKNPDFPPRFKKAMKDGGGFSGGGERKSGGTFKPRDPSEIAGARHAHNLLVAAHSFLPLPERADGSEIQERINNLEAFACVLDEKTAAISDAAKSAPKKEDGSDLPF